ncbi:GNAT family N-acetyltransferase [Roseateles cavernae]|uniref:GNAT family N-acetyltransferase n=1 Tax=Roseateles cavernae TaxID=3153578 RepID=UPI0032E49BA4
MTTPDPVLIQVPERLLTERLVIAAPHAGLGQALNAAVCESLDELKPWMPWAQTAPSIEESETVLRHQLARFILRSDLTYQFYLREPGSEQAGRLLGGTGLHRFDWTLRRFEIGYWIRTSAQGRGYVSEAVQALACMAFDQLRARRVEIRMDERNLRSRAVAERCGFEFEGVLRRDALSPSGEPRDTRVYSRIA